VELISLLLKWKIEVELIKVEALQSHGSHDVYKKAVNILERYFAGEEEEEQ